MKHILIGTSSFGKYQRQDLCIESLQKLSLLNSNVDCCLVQQLEDQTSYSNIRILNKLTRNSSTVFKTNKKIPFINDIFNVLYSESTDIFVFCNSDIILTQKLINYINSIEVQAFGISRIDISEINSLTEPARILRMEPAGFDCWVISKQWWTKNQQLFQDFVIGRPYFDVIYTTLMFLNSTNPYISNEHLVYHVLHERAWLDKDECYHYNRLQKELYYEDIEKVWGECCNDTFLRRADWGKFLRINSDEADVLLSIKNNHKPKQF